MIQLENNYYEQHKNDKVKIEIKEVKEPNFPYDKTLTNLIPLISQRPTTKSEIIEFFCKYIEQYIKYIQGKITFSFMIFMKENIQL